jgi:hypothetical protein
MNQLTYAATLTLELADGDVLTAQERIISLLKNAHKYTHLLYDSQIHVKARIGNDFYYEVYPDGTKAMRRSYVESLIPNKMVYMTELLEDIVAVLKGEADRCTGF